MGDFVGAMLKYLRAHEVAKVTIAGGFAKMTKLGQGLLDLHSGRGEVDFSWLAARCAEAGAGDNVIAHVKTANSAREVLDLASAERFDIGAPIAEAAWRTAAKVLRGGAIALEIADFRPRWQSSRANAVPPRSLRFAPETALVVFVIERACAKIPGAKTCPTRISAVRSIGVSATIPAMVASVPRRIV